MLLKPKVITDIQTRKVSVFRPVPARLNLGASRTVRLPLSRVLKFAVLFGALWFFIVGSAAAPTIETLAANPPSDEERRALEAQLKELEGQILEYESQVASYRKQGASLKDEIARLNNKIAKLNLQIKAVILTLKSLDNKIGATQSEIEVTEASIARNQEALIDLLRNVYENDRASLMEIFLKNPKLSDFFTNLNHITILQGTLRTTIKQISDLRDQLQDQKEQYALARADAKTLHDYQLAQRGETDKTKQEKNQLLGATKGQESRYQALLKETKETAAKIRSRIFQLLGGGELTFEQAYEYAKLASGATGVRPALILAVLDRESALGRNVGQCGYNTAMNPKDRPVFLEITAELGLNPDTMLVSCPNSDGLYGGAMGPAQFIPSTWRIYDDRVSQITGRTPASPWNNADAFVAAALYLKDAGAANNERIAAARYYCGARWNRYVCLNVYGRRVVEQAQRFQEDIDTITS